jgi:uncharacterized protein YndB with AHSA1/START domain
MTAAAELDIQRTVTHGTFVLERTYPQPPRAVFDAWASRDAKYAWFAEGIDFLRSVEEYQLDFRVGGVERLAGVLERSGNRFEYNSTYADIVDARRIVAVYDVVINGRRISASLLTVELEGLEGEGDRSDAGRDSAQTGPNGAQTGRDGAQTGPDTASQGGTHLIMTEQGAFFDGLDTNEERIVGATDSLDDLERFLNR